MTPLLVVLLINLFTAVLRTGRYFSLIEGTLEPQVLWLGWFMAIWGAPVLQLALVVAAASWVVRRSGELWLLHGVLVGAGAAVAGQLVGLYYGPPVLTEAVTMLALSLSGGALGGYEGYRTLETQEAAYRTGRDLAAAQDPQGIAEAVGRYSAGPGVTAVALWRVTGEPAFLAAWVSESLEESFETPALDGFWPPERSERPSGAPVTIRLRNLPEPARAGWRKRGVRSTVGIPLSTPGGTSAYLLAVFSRRPGFSRSAIRRYQTAGVQAALALENRRLLAEARRSGKQAGVLRERQRLAHEIHDTLAQGFTSIVMNLEAAEQSLDSKPDLTKKSLSHARRVARESLSETRRLVRALQPEQLESASLAEVLERLAARLSEESGIFAEATVTGAARQLPHKTEAVLLRIAQEALANVRKHSRARRAALTLSYMPDFVVLDTRDDGVGFDPAGANGHHDDSGGFGLQGMRERVAGVGGTLVVESLPGEGTTITAELPLKPEKRPGASGYETTEEPLW